MSQVERVARRIFMIGWRVDGSRFGCCFEHDQEVWMEMAREAIAAMSPDGECPHCHRQVPEPAACTPNIAEG